MDLKQYDTVDATFRPKNLETLRFESRHYIGYRAKWLVAWMIEESDNPEYAGQWAFTLDPHDLAPIGWVPECDLEIHGVVDGTQSD